MSDPDFVIRQGDTASDLLDVCRDADGDAVSIAGADVEFQLRPIRGGDGFTRAGTNREDADDILGGVGYSWQAGDTADEGFYLGSWIITFAAGDVQTFPNEGYVLVYVTADAPTDLGQDYLTLEELKATLEMDDTSFADDDMRRAITSASRGVDGATDRWFYRTDPSNDEERYYRPSRRITLEIDDLIGLTSVEVDQDGDGTYEQEWTLNTDFVLEPENAELRDRPWERIRLHPYGRYFMPTHIPRAVKVTGQFGWTAVPEPVKTATAIIASKLLKRTREAPFAIVFSAEAATRLAKVDPDVTALLEDYSREAML